MQSHMHLCHHNILFPGSSIKIESRLDQESFTPVIETTAWITLQVYHWEVVNTYCQSVSPFWRQMYWQYRKQYWYWQYPWRYRYLYHDINKSDHWQGYKSKVQMLFLTKLFLLPVLIVPTIEKLRSPSQLRECGTMTDSYHSSITQH